MKKLITIIIALAALFCSAQSAFAQDPGFDDPANWWSWVAPISGQTDAFKFNFIGKLNTDFYDDYGTPSNLDCNGDGTVNALDRHKDGLFKECGYWFEILAKRGRLVKVGTTTMFSVVDGIVYAQWQKLFQHEIEDDVEFIIRLTQRDPLTKVLIEDEDFKSDPFSICEFGGATSHIDACKPDVPDDPSNDPSNDLCPNDPNKTEPGLCDCGRVDVDNDNNGVCDLDEPNPTSHTQDTDGDGWMNATETLCGSDYLVATSVPDDHDNDGICDVQDPDDDNDGWSDTVEIVCGTSPYNSSEVCAEGDVDISTPGDDDLFGTDGDDAGMLAPPPPSSNADFGEGSCSLNPGATARTAWPILLILTCFAMPIVLNLRTRKRK